MNKLFDDASGVIRAGSEIVQSGIKLGRAESEKRIKELEDRNAKLLEALKSAQSFFESITCHCAEGVEFFDRAKLMETIEVEAMKAYNDIGKAIEETEE